MEHVCCPPKPVRFVCSVFTFGSRLWVVQSASLTELLVTNNCSAIECAAYKNKLIVHIVLLAGKGTNGLMWYNYVCVSSCVDDLTYVFSLAAGLIN